MSDAIDGRHAFRSVRRRVASAWPIGAASVALAFAANAAARAPRSPAPAPSGASSEASSVSGSTASSQASPEGPREEPASARGLRRMGGASAGATLLDPPAVLVSRQLLERRGLHVGQVVSFSSAPSGAGAKPFRIAGIYEPTPDPMRLTAGRLEVRFHLPDLLAMTADRTDPLSAESVSAVNLTLADPSGALRFARDLAARMPGIVAAPTRGASGDGNPFAVLERFHLAIALVTVIGSSAFLLALMVMRADERRETAGILRLIGLSRARILGEILFEGLFIATAGASFGILLAAAVQGAVNGFFQWRYDTALVFVRVTVPIAVKCVALAVPLGVLAGLVASWSLLRRNIVALLHR